MLLPTAAALALSGCASSAAPGPDPSPGGVGFDDVQSATIQIEAVGTFVSPEGGYEAAGRGSGFVISDEGLAITNNHVVVGAGTLKVWLRRRHLADAQRQGARIVGMPRPGGHPAAEG